MSLLAKLKQVSNELNNLSDTDIQEIQKSFSNTDIPNYNNSEEYPVFEQLLKEDSMTILEESYDIKNFYNSQSQLLINPISCDGKTDNILFTTFPHMYNRYVEMATTHSFNIDSRFYVYNLPNGRQQILNFPTKSYIDSNSKLEFVDKGLNRLSQIIINKHIQSVIIPPDFSDGLEWDELYILFDCYLSDIQDCKIKIYKPTDIFL